jgi:hypothetical protein
VIYVDETECQFEHAVGPIGGPFTISVLAAALRFGGVCYTDSTSLAIDAAGAVHAVVRDRSVRYARFDGDEWEIETVDTFPANDDTDLSLAVDASGGVHISYYDPSEQDLLYAHACR